MKRFLRRGEVLAKTGWDARYFDKLREAKVVIDVHLLWRDKEPGDSVKVCYLNKAGVWRFPLDQARYEWSEVERIISEAKQIGLQKQKTSLI